jgi:WD40 repeat protein
MAFSGDSRLLATGTDDGQVRIWSTATAQAVQLPLWHPGPVSTVRFSGDGEGVATLAADGTVRLWNLAAGQAERPPWLRQGGCSGVACAPDESAIATAAGDTISIWDAVTLRPRGAAIHCPGDVGPLAFAPRGDLLAGGLFTTASGKGTVGVWNLATGSSEMRAFGTEPGAPAFSPDGRLLAVLALDGTVRLWEVATGQSHGQPLRGPREEVTWVDVRFSSDGRYVIARNGFETLRIWECATGKLLYADRPISGCSVDGQRILAISKEGAAVLQADTGRPCGNPVPLGAMFTLPPVLDPGGQTVAAVAGQGITLWDVATGRLRVPSLPLSGHCRRLAFSPDASLLAAIVGREILVWDVTTGKRYGRPLPVTGEWIPDIVFSPRGGILISPAFQRFSAPPPDPEDIERQTWAVLGARVNAQGTVEAIPAVEWLTLRRNLAETRPTPSASK